MELFEVVCKMLLFTVILLNILIEMVFHTWPLKLSILHTYKNTHPGRMTTIRFPDDGCVVR